MWHYGVRALLRLVIVGLLLGTIPPAATPQAQAHSAAIAGPPAASAAPTATAQPTLPTPIASTPVPHPELLQKLRAGTSALPTTTPDLSKQTLAFIPNRGQTDAAVRFNLSKA